MSAVLSVSPSSFLNTVGICGNPLTSSNEAVMVNIALDYQTDTISFFWWILCFEVCFGAASLPLCWTLAIVAIFHFSLWVIINVKLVHLFCHNSKEWQALKRFFFWCAFNSCGNIRPAPLPFKCLSNVLIWLDHMTKVWLKSNLVANSHVIWDTSASTTAFSSS